MKTFKVVLADTRRELADTLNKPMSLPTRWICHAMVFIGAAYLWWGERKFRRRIRRAVRAADKEMARKYPEWHKPIL